MKLSKKAYEIIEEMLPIPRKPPKYSHKKALEGILYVLSSGCSWRQLPREYGHWHTIYTRFKRWAENGVLMKLLLKLQNGGVCKLKVVYLDSTIVKAHHSASGAQKKRALKV